MNKSTVILIIIIYVASILVINFFGMKMAVYNEIIPVDEITCLNESKEFNNNQITVDNTKDPIIIKTKFTTPANKDDLTGTMIQLEWRVLPDNASNKKVKFVYTPNNRFEFYKNENGEETGLVLFYNYTMITVEITSTDGRKVTEKITLWVKP